MEIKHQQDGADGIFYVAGDNVHAAELQYASSGDNTIEIFHTQVAEELQGKSIGKQLIEAAVDFARQKHLKIIPSCTFAKSVFAAEESYGDVLA
jgi:predicted GNAT family acetyltransferase